MIKFSYIIPTYNRYEKLKETVSSILKQNGDQFEIIIIDDGSSDNSHKIIEHYNNNKIKYYYNVNSGVSIARNLGFKYAKGDFIIFLDSDDLVTKDQLIIFENAIINNPDYDIYFSSYVFWHSLTNQCIERKEITKGSYYDFFKDCINGIQPCFPGCVCISRNIIEKKEFIFEPNCNFGEDQKLWVELFSNHKCYSIPEITMKYRVDSNSSLSKKKVIKLPPDINSAYKLRTKDSIKYVLHRLSVFSIISIKTKNLTLFKEIITFSHKKKILTLFVKAFFSHIKNKTLNRKI
ncbi:glycosyltransferase family 2 protein [Escherichia coli]|uniref:glycosyltransferase family 2 protein n=1 Tax=Enterobacterales TaxID=91347 RepID=UPI00128F5CF6|nr:MULTISPECIES: glycosyltransferase family 2 protein [Enterobacterales]MQK50361.1 glycosyltransferase family 2 protein [Escherichia coli]QFV07563.1 glycosyltransferase [Proteus mirabilis]HAP3151589.1 glycosyltransferase family 2 protein [Escherichia coli]HAW2772902.1 glycosyltransferase family 2 protein [Escherichia coli]